MTATKRRKAPPTLGGIAPHATAGERIDYLGHLRERIAELQDAERAVARLVKKAVAGLHDPARGAEFLAALDDVWTVRLTLGQIERLASQRGVAREALVRPDLAACRKVFGDEAVDAAGTPHHSRRLRVERLRPAAAKRTKK